MSPEPWRVEVGSIGGGQLNRERPSQRLEQSASAWLRRLLRRGVGMVKSLWVHFCRLTWIRSTA
jgi:hypothetical protein